MAVALPSLDFDTLAFHVSRLHWRHLDGLFALASEPEMMRHIGRGRVWTRDNVLDAVRTAVDDAARKSTRYQHFAFMCNNRVVGYSRFVCKNMHVGGEFVVRVFCRKGFGAIGMRESMRIVKESVGESLPRAAFVAEVHKDNDRAQQFFKRKLHFQFVGFCQHGYKYVLPLWPSHYVTPLLSKK